MSGILYKMLVQRFYRINTGFFLLLFLLLFCLLDGKSTIALHYGIMQGITSSYLFASVAMLVCALYNYKCVSFCVKEMNRPENCFLFSLQSVDNNKQFSMLLSCHGAMYLPLLAYSSITVMVGFGEHHYLQVIVFLVFQLLMCGMAAAIYFRQINATWTQPALRLPELDISRKKHFLFYLLHYSLSTRKGTFIGIKLLSLLLLQAMVAANADKLSNEAICVLIMFLISIHSLLPVYYVGFMEGELSFLRNLPIPVLRRMLVYVVTYAIVFLPELLFLLLNEHHIMPLQLTLSLYALSVAQLTLYTAIQYVKKIPSERYMGWVFGLFFMNLLLLASFDLWYLFAVEAVVSVVLFVRSYNVYEYIKGKS